MKSFLAIAVVLCASLSFAADAPKLNVPLDGADARDARELGKQVHDIKKKARVAKASAYRRYKAHKLEGRAKAVRNENYQAEQKLTGK
jgi:hypothetical protein